jgi:hypothetical protein
MLNLKEEAVVVENKQQKKKGRPRKTVKVEE